jgi:hypothetical protein
MIQTPQACDKHTLDFIWEEGISILQHPLKQMIYSTLKPVFNGDNALETVINSNAVHTQ